MVLGNIPAANVEDRLKELGYTLTKEELDNLFARFKSWQTRKYFRFRFEALAADRQIEQPGATSSNGMW